jgi:hypothetical protein
LVKGVEGNMHKRYSQVADRPELAERLDERPVDIVRPAETEFVSYARPTSQPKRWEYRRLDRSGSSQLLSEDQLDAMGVDSWELAGVVSDFSVTHYYFQRGRSAYPTLVVGSGGGRKSARPPPHSLTLLPFYPFILLPSYPLPDLRTCPVVVA